MKNKIRLLLIFTFLIIFSYTLLSNKYLGDVEYMNYAYNNYFSEYSLEFKNDDKLDQFIQSLINDKKDISISSVDLKNNIIKIASYNDSFKPKIVKGRYFNTDDNNVCIVCENGLYKIGDYYKIDGIEYKVIGLYKEMHLSSDDLVFLKLSDIDYKMPICLVIGNEGRGISKIVNDNCDYIATIPMVGKVNSLNASVSCAIILSRIVSSRGI